MFHPQGPTFWELAEQALSSTERGYDLLAPKFDYTPFRTPDWLLAPVADYLRTLPPFGAGLDVCCGTGAAVALLRPFCTERVVGLDFSHGMLAICRRHAADLAGAVVRPAVQRGDACEELPRPAAVHHVLPDVSAAARAAVARTGRPARRGAPARPPPAARPPAPRRRHQTHRAIADCRLK